MNPDLDTGFLGVRLYQLLAVIDEQGNEVLRNAGIELPSRLSSTIAILKRLGPQSVTDIGRRLKMSHQLVAHRINALTDLGLIAQRPDTKDGRRRLIHLTRKGSGLARRLDAVADRAGVAYTQRFDELGVDLDQALRAAVCALQRDPLAERIARLDA